VDGTLGWVCCWGAGADRLRVRAGRHVGMRWRDRERRADPDRDDSMLAVPGTREGDRARAEGQVVGSSTCPPTARGRWF